MELAGWRDLAIVLSSIEFFIVALIPGVIVYFMVRGMSWLIKQVHVFGPVAQGYARKGVEAVEKGSNAVTAPVVRAEGFIARVRRAGAAAMSVFPFREVRK